MSLIGFVPCAPLLVPQVAGGSAAVDDPLREACREVVRRLLGAGDAITVVAPVGLGATWSEDATWGFEGFGVDRVPADPRRRLPWQLGIGDWLLDDAGWSGVRRYIGVTPGGSAPVPEGALLVIGDGSARRTEKAPGHLDERAEPFDAVIAAALRDGDLLGLGGLDPELAADLMCAGAPVWRAVATARSGQRVAEADLLAEVAPYGVGYFAAWWRLAPA